MGLATAKMITPDYHLIIAGRTVAKLDGALESLSSLGADVEAFPCDVTDSASVQKMAEYAAGLGPVKAALNTAGLSPKMASGSAIFTTNALGAINMTTEFAKVMPQNSCILNVASMAAYMVPSDRVPIQAYKIALSDPAAFCQTMTAMLESMPDEEARGAAYSLSKNFVKWFSERAACLYGKAGVRVVSISPGTTKTPMGDLEGEEAAAIAQKGALGRVGEVDELANVMAFIISEKASYLTGADILCDGGTIAALENEG